jgi:hypothetical protein
MRNPISTAELPERLPLGPTANQLSVRLEPAKAAIALHRPIYPQRLAHQYRTTSTPASAATIHAHAHVENPKTRTRQRIPPQKRHHSCGTKIQFAARNFANRVDPETGPIGLCYRGGEAENLMLDPKIQTDAGIDVLRWSFTATDELISIVEQKSAGVIRNSAICAALA